MKSIDVAAIGELLADFMENGMSRQGNPVFTGAGDTFLGCILHYLLGAWT
ncbi:MAG: hypothetical protein HFH30_09505 [Eubacterium sp.]|nr:hypothetical protein [Eubacterium sp.]